MEKENLKSRCKRRLIFCFGPLVVLGLAVIPATKITGAESFPASAPATMTPPAVPNACGNLKPEEIYARLKKETFSHNGYTATYFHQTERGKKHEIFARGELTGKYLQKPLMFCERRISSQTSFPEQASVGTQECYSAKDDLTRILMPGAYRALGVIIMFSEDPKASYLNGENNNNTPVWTWFKIWDRMLEGGQLSAKCETRKGKPAWVLILIRGKNPDPLYHHNEMRIWVDPEFWFPVRLEKYVPNDPRPVVIYDFEQLNLDAQIMEKDIAFEGVAPKYSLIGAPGGPKLAGLIAQEPVLQNSPDLDPNSFVTMLDQALAEPKDYSTDLTLELKYRRLRQYRQDRFLYIRLTNSFSSLTTHLEANYMQINNGENFRTVYDPIKDNLLHILPAGVYKFMGEQIFPTDDPRLFSALGDNIYGLNFFTIRDELKRWLAAAEQKRTGQARYGDLKGPWLELIRKSQGIPAYPTVMRLMLDEQTRLPARLEYRGYDDPKACLTIRFSNTKINTGITSENLWR